MTTALDPRLTPARPDLAARHLEGRVAAARFVAGDPHQVFDAQAPLRKAPRPDAPLLTEALKGERLTVYDFDDEGWAWVQLDTDRYVGYMPSSALIRPGAPATHRVAVPRTLIFPGPDIKLPPVASPPLGAGLAILRVEDRFAVASEGFLPSTHVVPLDQPAPDFVSVAERFIGAPYLWGGKTSHGLDCSGLVQIALQAAGFECLRDSDMQERNLGVALDDRDIATGLRRGDLVFWKGHVGIMRDATTLLHANAFHMLVASEPLAEAVARIAATDGAPVRSIRRIGFPDAATPDG